MIQTTQTINRNRIDATNSLATPKDDDSNPPASAASASDSSDFDAEDDSALEGEDTPVVPSPRLHHRSNSNSRARATPAVPFLSSLRDMHASHVVLTNTVFGVEHARPSIRPRFRMVGPLLPATPEPLQPLLAAWLDDAAATNQDVYVIGSLLRLC